SPDECLSRVHEIALLGPGHPAYACEMISHAARFQSRAPENRSQFSLSEIYSLTAQWFRGSRRAANALQRCERQRLRPLRRQSRPRGIHRSALDHHPSRPDPLPDLTGAVATKKDVLWVAPSGAT